PLVAARANRPDNRVIGTVGRGNERRAAAALLLRATRNYAGRCGNSRVFREFPRNDFNLVSRPRMRCRARSRCRGRPASPANEIELTDSGGETEAGSCVVVFVHVPERHAIGGINSGHAIIAPASEAIELAARAIE